MMEREEIIEQMKELGYEQCPERSAVRKNKNGICYVADVGTFDNNFILITHIKTPLLEATISTGHLSFESLCRESLKNYVESIESKAELFKTSI